MVSGTRKRLRAEERRERILEGALKVFAERGYGEASMTAIAHAAGISPAVIYDHFASKAELHMTLLEWKAEALMSSVAGALATAPDDPRERMRAGVDAFFAFVEQENFAWWVLFRDPPTDPKVSAAYAQIQRNATLGIAAFIREMTPPELLEDPNADRDLEIFGQLLRTAQNGLAAWWYDHRDVPRDVLVDRVIEFCWIGFERLAGGERLRSDG